MIDIIKKQLQLDKIKINWNKNPVPMDLFLSFLTVSTERSKNYLGESTNWTQYENPDYKLIIRGGICDGGHWLHTIEYGTKLGNRYNNYVNPFYLFDIMNKKGRKFFLDYYKEDIDKIISIQEEKIVRITEQLAMEKTNYLNMLSEHNEYINN